MKVVDEDIQRQERKNAVNRAGWILSEMGQLAGEVVQTDQDRTIRSIRLNKLHDALNRAAKDIKLFAV